MRNSNEETADLITFTEEILNGKLHILCSVKHLINSLNNNPTGIFSNPLNQDR